MGFAETYNRFIQYLDDSFAIMAMARHSVSSAEARVGAAEALFILEDGDLPDLVWTPERIKEQNELIDRLKKEAAFARKEIDNGFPILNAHETVGLWGGTGGAD